MATDFTHSIAELENVILVCFGRPRGQELPQVASEDDIIIDLMAERTGRSRNFIDAEIHHQIEH